MPDISLKDIITKDVFTLKTYDNVSDMLNAMSNNKLSCSVIVDDENFPVGIFTQKDAIKLISSEIDINTTNIAEVMSSPVLSANESLGFFEAYELIYTKKIRHLIVVDHQGKLSGIATEHDFLTHIGLEFFVVNKTAMDIAKTNFPTLTADKTLSDALVALESTKNTSLVVLDNGIPKALISEKEILECAATQIPLYTKLSTLNLKKPLFTTTDTTLQAVIVQMHQNHATDLIVNNMHGEFYGVIQRHDIMTSLHGKTVDFLLKTLNKKEFTISTLEAQQKELNIFMSAFKGSVNAVVITDKDATIQWANPAFATLTGYDIEFALGKKPSELINSGVQSKEFYEAMWESINDGVVWKGIVTNKRKSGVLYQEELTITPIFNSQEEITHFIGFKEDITQKENLKKSLLKSELRFRELFEQAPLPYQSLDKNGVILDINRAWLENFGYTKEEVLGHNYAEFITSSSLATLTENFPVLVSSGAIEGPEFEFITKKKGARWVQVQGRTSKDENGIFLHTHCILSDITAQKYFIEELKENEKKFKELFIHAPFAYQSLDLEGTILEVNKKWTELSGYTENEVKGKFIGNFLTERSLEEFRKVFAPFIQNGYIQNQAFVIVGKNGKNIHIELNGSLTYDDAGMPLHTHCILFDVSESNAIQQERREIESVFKNTNEGIIVTDKNQNITRVNQAFFKLTGYSEKEVINKKPTFLKSGKHDKEFYTDMWQKIQKDGYWHGEIWNRKKNGELYPELLSINQVNDTLGETVNYIGVFSDITQQKLSEQQLEHLAHHDALTQLPNRLLLLSSLDSSIRAYGRHPSISALLLLDLDRFKNVNDSYGHLVGDELLQKIADRLNSRLRNVDLICRLGGDEFAILLPNITNVEDAGNIASEIITLLTESWNLTGDISLQIGVSIGISIINAEIKSSQEMLQYADVALYQAKSKGGNNFVYYANEMTLQARKKIELEQNLRQAIAKNELEVYLQPQINIKTKKLMGAEALIRWIDPIKGVIYPDEFIPIAEESDLIKEIGSFVLNEACRVLSKWNTEHQKSLSISINVSALQLKDNSFVDEVRNAILKFKINPKYLELELTESAIMKSTEDSLVILHALRSLGVKLVLDDFGTGYSSLSYLKKFPLDILKVDKSFVGDIPQDKDDTAITQAIIKMGHILNFAIVAEGVETQEQLDFLEFTKCDTFQGYLESKPISVNSFETKYLSFESEPLH
ncbi:MAG: PAS domain S-box protein [Sulfurimonas sp.]|nr:PAS domain S-box protein [Sulfurimonas sp.]MBU3938163.1 PAS domain S-box protein [bacterium]MBU4025771.1 PAS domain S-box protein [bacterium]MBU4111506.1 PAS domain S-box protein [bacterium]